jgi:hypothetical protein
MRSIVWLLAVTCLSIGAVSPAKAAPIEVGFRAGFNLATLEGDEADLFEEAFGTELESRNALHAGGWVAWRLAPSFALQIEAVYAQKGAHGDVVLYVPGPVELEVTYALSYLEVPVLARLELGTSHVRPRLLLGTALGVPIGGEVRVEALGEEESEDLDDLLVDWSLIVGAGFGVPIGTATMVFDVRFQPSITEVAEDSDTRNRVLSMSVSLGW